MLIWRRGGFVESGDDSPRRMMNAQRNRRMYLRVGERLAEIRNSQELSQGELAKRLGVTVGTIQNYERVRNEPNITRLTELALALRCEPTDLLKPPGSPIRYQRGDRLRPPPKLVVRPSPLAMIAKDLGFYSRKPQISNTLDADTQVKAMCGWLPRTTCALRRGFSRFSDAVATSQGDARTEK
jgi:transcriptional regulator with XRE-family HTH domain